MPICADKVSPRLSTAAKVGGNQIIGAFASANIEFRCGGAYQIAVGIERAQKARLIEAGVWLNLSQCAFVYEE